MADVEKRIYLNIEGGKKIAMPRYYKDKLYDYESRLKVKAYYSEQYDPYLHPENVILVTREVKEAREVANNKFFNKAHQGRKISGL